MISSIRNFMTGFFGQREYFRDAPDNIQDILRELEQTEECSNDDDDRDSHENSVGDDFCTEKKLGEVEPDDYNVQYCNCVHKTGTVTYVGDEYGFIDNVIYFDLSKVVTTLTLREGDEVAYMSYQKERSGEEAVFRIYALKCDSWEIGDKVVKEEDSQNEAEEEIAVMPMVMTGRVTQRRGRKLFIEPSNVWCNLEEIDSTYVPIEGDWVSLEASVAVNKEKVNMAGDVIEIKSLQPVLQKSNCGRITLWSESKQEGAIENQIYFHKIFCSSGYVPALGDDVFYEAIESDQGVYRWRALSISPKSVSAKLEKSKIAELKGLMEDKNGISISPEICSVKLQYSEVSEVAVVIRNTGTESRRLLKVRFPSSPKSSQLSIAEPLVNKQGIQINPNETLHVKFRCRGMILGTSEEMCLFYFDGFRMVRPFSIVVGSDAKMKDILPCETGTTYYSRGKKKFIRSKLDVGNVIFGPKPWQPPKFIGGERRGYYRVPEKLWDVVSTDSGHEKIHDEAVKSLIKYAPYMKEDLNWANYGDRFHLLLFLEEIQQDINHSVYNRTGVFLYRKGEYFTLEVPQLCEQKPTLIMGDKVVVTQPWSMVDKDVRYVGYIYDVREKEIYLKFHEVFHQNYDESECDISFEPNKGQLMLAHDAINRAKKNLGQKLLFPKAVDEKSSQLEFTVDDESFNMKIGKLNINDTEMKKVECEIDPKGYVTQNCNAKKLVWFNKNLNERQKMAVVNVLKGHGRPLPYVIFGPPGTGKTITLVEVIMQIYRLIPESRMLVTTPSNSSADLICERLIEAGKFKPGQLVRLVAMHKVCNNSIPPKLVPYSTLIDIADDCNKGRKRNVNNISLSTYDQLVGRHRITVGTCACVGNLHQLPFPPGHFTHILVDEAGQATEPDVLIPLSFHKITNGQSVLVGDPKQLGPVSMSKLAKQYGLGASLMERLLKCFPYQKDVQSFGNTSGYDPRFITKLTVNYRAVPEILSLPNKMFYESELVATVSQKDSKEGMIIENFNFKKEGSDTPAAIIFHAIVGENQREPATPSFFNPHEVWETVTYTKKLYEAGLKCSDIGIITPYVQQVRKLRHVLDALKIAQPKIGTVEEFQGQERNVIIISAVRSSTKRISSNIREMLGFLACPQRLNVALTRARALLIILGNPLFLAKDPHWKTVIEYCQSNKSFTGCNFFKFDDITNLEDGEEENDEVET
ncbi:hypothetical protein RUM43_009317 [Polyplax serrata]|uniref:RNA helicase n=1 Tax=Polyplax serrata TaxID=468196 RepID=A0AAN8S4G3_POLSC